MIPILDLSSFVARMTTLWNEFATILAKSTDAASSKSKIDEVFIILTLIKLGLDFDYIQEQILIRATVLTFEDVFNRLFRNSSIATGSSRSKPISDSTVLLSQSSTLSLTFVGCVGVVVVKVPVLSAHTVIDFYILVIVAISCVVVLHALVMWLRPLLHHLQRHHLALSLIHQLPLMVLLSLLARMRTFFA